MNRPAPIRVLASSVARKIAAGEVIERPGGVVRELLDNSLDAQANQIDVELHAGGIELLRVVDNGTGMSPDDLERCVLPHATSKIETDDDLLRVRTLGFRGEALSSVAAVSRLEITSCVTGETPHRLRVEGSRVIHLGPAAGSHGTTVNVADLFYNVPARRQFLKRASSEFTIARGVLLDKALAFPDVAFRLTSNAETRLSLPVSSRLERIAAAYPERTEPAHLHEIEFTGDGFRGTVVAGEPTAHRKDRKGLQVFVNRRRVWEYALVQAVEYAYRDYLHGGLYPVAYLFLEIEPELVDFNIHPAKREVRFRNLPEIHRRVVSALGGWLHVFDHKAAVTGTPLPFPSGDAPRAAARGLGIRPLNDVGYDLQRVYSPSTAPLHASDASTTSSPWEVAESPGLPAGGADETPSFRYLGQVMNLFLVVELAGRLLLVDQHAAHERVIYDRLRAGSGGQELLFPVRLELEPDAAETIANKRADLKRVGIELEERDGGWELTTVPSSVSIEAESLAALLMDLLDRPSDFERELYASLSCRSAVMDGDRLADETATAIIAGVIALENARCPHGRPIWTEWTRDQLATLVGRT